MVTDWNITKPAGCCHGTGQNLKAGEDYFAALVETEQGFERRDYCRQYWQQEKPEVYCFWKSTVPDPQVKKKLFIDDDMLMAFFDRLEDEEDVEKMNFRFVLMLVLMRKRFLKYETSETEDGREVWIVKVRGQDRKTKVVNPNLTEDKISELTSQMGQILQTDIEISEK